VGGVSVDVFRVAATNIWGGEVSFTPSFVRLRRSLESPAEVFTGRFPVPARPAELVRVQVFRNDEPIFEGKIDEQRLTLSSNGMLLQLDARNRGGLLLDNEAMPETLAHPTTHMMFERLIARHGFTLIATPRSLPEFTIRKGLTLWDAFAVFARRTYGRLPYVVGDAVIVSGTDLGEGTLLLGGSGLPFSRLEHVISHQRMISRIFIRDEEGYYRTFVDNPHTAGLGIVRERFLIPSGEFAAIPRWDSASRIRRSMRQAISVVAELPGFAHLRLGRGVAVDNPLVSLPNLMVDESVFTLDQNGARTVLTLANWLHD